MRLLWLTMALMLGACNAPAPSTSTAPAAAPHEPGMYYWKTGWEFTAADRNALHEAGFRQLFLRLFDVDWDFNRQEARPKGMIQLPDSLSLDSSLAVTPVVFIVERVFRQDIDVDKLAERIGRTITGLASGHLPLTRATRWQIDCDWTPTSRDRYFSFLESLQRRYPGITLNVTVRLHQYRERIENGIPPVPEGLLMCYNMEPVQKAGSTNAIYREDLLRGYLKAPPYPIPLDAALPVFEWGAAFRDGRFLGIVDAPSEIDGMLDEVSPGRFLVLSDTTIASTFLRGGDHIRHDGARGASELNSAAALLKQRPEIRDLLFFDWQPGLLEKHTFGEILEEFYR